MSAAKSAPAGAKRRLAAVVLDEESIGRSNPDVEHERQVAIYDLLELNSFAPVGHESGPYTLHLSINGNRLVFDIRQEDGTPVVAHLFSLTPLRRIVKDYYMKSPPRQLRDSVAHDACNAFIDGRRFDLPGEEPGAKVASSPQRS